MVSHEVLLANLNPERAFDALKDRVKTAISAQFPITGKKHRVELVKLEVKDTLDIDDIRSQHETKLKDETWDVPVKGTLRLVDIESGKVLDESTVTLAKLPKITRRYTYIIKGHERQHDSVFRMKPGVFHRVADNGAIQSKWNLYPGHGFDLDINRGDGTVKMGVGSSNIPLYPVLKALNVSDADIEKRVGPEVFRSYQKQGKTEDVRKLLKALAYNDADKKLITKMTPLEMSAKLTETYAKTGLRRPDGSGHNTLGTHMEHVTGEGLLASAGRLLDISKGVTQPDDRHALSSKDIHGTEDFIAEIIVRKQKEVTRKVLNTLDAKDKISDISLSNLYTSAVRSTFDESQFPEQHNPTAFVSGHLRTTLLGAAFGGVKGEHGSLDEDKLINPTHLGFLDPIQSPEADAGIILHLPVGVKRVGHELVTSAWDVKAGKMVDATPAMLEHAVVAYPDQVTWKAGKPSPRENFVTVYDEERATSKRPWSSVQYVLPSAKTLFSFNANLIPFLSSNSGPRASFATKQMEQAVSLVGREAPLVQNKSEGKASWEQVMGLFASHVAPEAGVVKHISKEAVHLVHADGTKSIVPLYDHFPLNGGKDMLHSTPLVKVGDKVTKMQPVADSNFTQGGTLALGRNLNVGYTTYLGRTFEDSIVISETAAKKLTSEHLHVQDVTLYGGMSLNKKMWRGITTPDRSSPSHMGQLDDDGVIKEGSRVQHGDVLVAVVSERIARPEEAVLGNIHKRLDRPFEDRHTEVWDHDYPGTVVRVSRSGKTIKVFVKTEEPATVGDKLTARYGNKGIIGCHDAKTEVLTAEGWKPFSALTETDRVCTLNPSTEEIEYHVPVHRIEAHYSGPMYRYAGRRLDLFTTPNHKHWVRTPRSATYEFREASDCFGSHLAHRKAGTWRGTEQASVTIPGIPHLPHMQYKWSEDAAYPADDFLVFFSYWVTEGCLGGSGEIRIAQRCTKNPDVYEHIFDVLCRLGFSPNAYDDTVMFYDTRLWAWLAQFGKAKDKFIPREFLEASSRQLRLMADALFEGDGGIYAQKKGGPPSRYELFTSSPTLANDYQELALKLGLSAAIRPQKGNHGLEYVVRWSFTEEAYSSPSDTRYGKKETWETYDGMVYCVEVQNHIVYIRRNGIPVWSGNSILPDAEMPHDAGGKGLEVILGPSGVPSRMNVGQVLETAASKIARKTGQPYVTDNFAQGVDATKKVLADLEKHGLSDTEEMFDPKTGRSLGQILVGDQYMLKLHHQVDKKMTARSHGGGYTSEGMSTSGRGIPGGGKTVDPLMVYALLSRGANANLREMFSWKSDSDQSEVWTAIQGGKTLPEPVPNRSMGKFIGYGRALGIHMEKKGDQYMLSPLTDTQTLKFSNGLIRFPDKALSAKNARTKEDLGGLFDPKVTGGLAGGYFAHMTLAQQMPNPVFKRPIRELLGMKESEYDRLTGPDGYENGKSGFDVLNDKLRAIDVDKELKATEAALPKLKGPAMDKAYRKVRYLRALKQLGTTPVEAYTNKHIPVLPPSMRKVQPNLDGTQTFDDLNGLYRAIGVMNAQITKADPGTPQSKLHEYKSALYGSVENLRMTGLDMGDARTKRHHSGLMEKMKGANQPKSSYFQANLVSRRQDLSGRSTIITAPELAIDEVGVPLPMAMEMYKPFVVREVSLSQGVTPLAAQDYVKQKHPAALQALHKIVAQRPVLLKRDPVLHQFSVQAFTPRITSGKAIGLHPLVAGGFNADHDGDEMTMFVPISTEAVDEAKKMFPSKNLFSPTTGKVVATPGQDSLLGLYQATAWGSRFKEADGHSITQEEALLHLEQGKLKPWSLVHVNGKQTTPGRLLLASSLPVAMQGHEKLLYDPSFRMNKKAMGQILATVANEHPQDYARVVDAWKDAGNKLSYQSGSSFGLKDFHDGIALRERVLAPYKKEEALIHASSASQKVKDAKVVELYGRAVADLEKQGEAHYKNSDNRVYEWAASGSRGGWGQFSQMTIAPVLVQDAKGAPVATPILQSYGEGLSISNYWTQMHGARKGAIDRASATADPGAMTKVIINTAINTTITSDDCGTTKGVALAPGNPDTVDRYLVHEVKEGGLDIPAGTLLTAPILAQIRTAHVDRVIVRSPLYCQMSKGICNRCFGPREGGGHYPVGTNIGVISGQALGEPITQLTMRTFHSGGTVQKGGYETASFERVNQIFNVPKILKGAATITLKAGTITHIEKNHALGGHDVHVDSVKHHIPEDRKLLETTVVGHELKAGHALSDGPINPHDLLKATGNIHVVRAYLADEATKSYSTLGVKRRNVETVIRAMTDVTQIEHAPGHPQFLRGQIVSLALVEQLNRKATREGVSVIEHTPLLKPMVSVPLSHSEDWMGRMNFQKLEQTLETGAAQAWTSDIHASPIAGIAHAAEFGKRKPQPLEE